MKRKTMALILALVMCLSLTVPAFAAETKSETIGGITITATSDGTLSYTGSGAFTDELVGYGINFLVEVTNGLDGLKEVNTVSINISSSITPDELLIEDMKEFLYSHGVKSVKITSSTGTVQTVGGFTDVKPGDYFADPVVWALEKGIAAGTSASTFSPNQNCTVAQILTFLWRANGSPWSGGKSNLFSDVKNSDYYYEAALWAAEKGMVSGDTFNGSRPCTRAMAMTYMWKAAGGAWSASGEFDISKNGVLSGYHGNGGDVVIPNGVTNISDGFAYNKDLISLTIPVSVTKMNFTAFDDTSALTDVYYEGSEAQWNAITVGYNTGGDWAFGDTKATIHYNSKMPEQSVETGFTDVPAAADYAQAVKWAVDKGVTSGTSVTTFSPDSVCTRGQIVTFLYRGLAK